MCGELGSRKDYLYQEIRQDTEKTNHEIIMILITYNDYDNENK